jgi:hypothetical protein
MQAAALHKENRAGCVNPARPRFKQLEASYQLKRNPSCISLGLALVSPMI